MTAYTEKLVLKIFNNVPIFNVIVETIIINKLVGKGSESVEPIVREYLSDPVSEVRTAGIEALGKIGDTRAVKPLCILLNRHSDHRVRYEAAKALGNLKDSSAIGALLDASRRQSYRDQEFVVAERAVLSIGEINDPSVLPQLVKFLEYSNVDIVDSALCKAIGNIRGNIAIEPLIHALEHRRNYSYDAAKALEKITGQSFGRSGKQWRRWYEDNKDRYLTDQGS